jgi:hypothetical protein
VRNEQGAGKAAFEKDGRPFLVADAPLRASDTGSGCVLALPEAPARIDRPLRFFLRFPQEGQDAELIAGLRDAPGLLAEARAWWRERTPFHGNVSWQFPGVYQDFLVACARNILQAREKRDGRLTFQVGPTVYRGLWVVDGNFILEAARYMGFDEEVQQGLETTWAMQGADGGIFAGGGQEHWKDTGIAMFTLVRQAELSGQWDYFRRMQPQIAKGALFLSAMRDKGRAEGSDNGRYGLLARGFGDGGIGGGLRDELTNTIWALAGLKAVADAADKQRFGGFEPAARLYTELNQAFRAAAMKEMTRHEDGFEYLPMVLRADSLWSDPDPWKRWRPQSGQWALAQTIYPGLLFAPDDPVVRGYLALMQSCAREDVPSETGWLPHDGLWNYDAGFAAHVYLWAGSQDWALRTFHGFLNHATPLYCWREEQPLGGALVGGTVGDMPHNWASAECVLFLRHMLALEDGAALRLLAGVGPAQLAFGEPFRIHDTPTRFGRIGLDLEPIERQRGWRLTFSRAAGPAPVAVAIPESLGGRFRLAEVSGAARRSGAQGALVDPAAKTWTATWRL